MKKLPNYKKQNLQSLCLWKFVFLISLSFVTSQQDEFRFTRFHYDGWASELSTGGFTDVITEHMLGVWATDRNDDVTFDVTPRDPNVAVTRKTLLNFHFAELKMRVGMDRVEYDNATVTVRATSGGRVTHARVRVRVRDGNNNFPIFRKSSYGAEIPEDSPVGSRVTTMRATDRDVDPVNRMTYYALDSYNGNFAVHPVTGKVFLTARVSHEWQREHSLTVKAIDRNKKFCASTTLIVRVARVNEHRPEMTLTKLAPGMSSNKTLAVLEVSDEDSGENGETNAPRIVDSDALKYVELTSGFVQQNYLLNLKRYPKEKINLNVTIRVTDNGSPQKESVETFFVEILSKDAFKPVFKEPTTFRMSEWSQTGAIIGELTGENPQKSHVAYEIVGGSNFFEFVPETNLLRLSKPVDREKRQVYNLTVAARYSDYAGSRSVATAIVRVVVDDVNDNDPVIANEHREITIDEGDNGGFPIYQVRAYDPDEGHNGTVTFKIVDSDGMPLRIDSRTGEIFVSEGERLDSDYLYDKRFYVWVRAMDVGSPYSRHSDVIITVNLRDVNDNAPKFTYSRCEVEFPQQLVGVAQKVISLNPYDVDPVPGESMKCVMTSGEDDFYIREGSCEIMLGHDSKRNLLDRQPFELFVEATDSQLKSEKLPVVVRFTRKKGSKPVVRCWDKLDETENEMRGESDIRKRFQQSIRSTDLLPNTFAPESSKKRYNVKVPEDARVGSEVLKVSVADMDIKYNGLTWFTIASGNKEARFTVDSKTGRLFLAKPLDRETRSHYQLVVEFTDLGQNEARKKGKVKIVVVVTDVNDNAPVFEQDSYLFEITENSGQIKNCHVRATDADAGSNSKVSYSISESESKAMGYKFNVDAVSGKITLDSSLDREKKDFYR